MQKSKKAKGRKHKVLRLKIIPNNWDINKENKQLSVLMARVSKFCSESGKIVSLGYHFHPRLILTVVPNLIDEKVKEFTYYNNKEKKLSFLPFSESYMTIYEQYGLAICGIPERVTTYTEELDLRIKYDPKQIVLLYCDHVNP